MIRAAERDDRPGLARRTVAVRQDDVGRVFHADDKMPGLGDHPAQRAATRGIHGVDGDPQPRRWRELACRFAHAACRSAMVVCTVITAPLRIRRRSALRPMLSAPNNLAILRKRCVEVPSTLRMISPARTPACAAGPPSTTDITIRPLD